MSDRLPRPDEIVSAYLDGELTPVEAAAVEADETLAARAQELRAVRDAVAAPVPAPSTELRDQMIAAAMDAARDATALGGVVVPLRRTLQPLLAVAATVVAIAAVVGAGLLASRLGGGDSDMASEAPAAEFDRSESAGTADSAAPEPAQAPATVMADDGFAYDEAMVEEPMAEEELMDEMRAAPESPDLDAAAAATAAAAEADAAADLAPAATTAPAAEADEAATGEPQSPPSDEAEPTDQTVELPVVDLGLLDHIDTLVTIVLAQSEAIDLRAEPQAEPGVCAAAVSEFASSIGAQPTALFVAVLSAPALMELDAMTAVRDDGTTVLIYAVEPECEPSSTDSEAELIGRE